jgi:hypothetical protein
MNVVIRRILTFSSWQPQGSRQCSNPRLCMRKVCFGSSGSHHEGYGSSQSLEWAVDLCVGNVRLWSTLFAAPAFALRDSAMRDSGVCGSAFRDILIHTGPVFHSPSAYPQKQFARCSCGEDLRGSLDRYRHEDAQGSHDFDVGLGVLLGPRMQLSRPNNMVSRWVPVPADSCKLAFGVTCGVCKEICWLLVACSCAQCCIAAGLGQE